MPDHTVYEVAPRAGGRWAVTHRLSGRATRVLPGRARAIALACDLAGRRPPSRVVVYSERRRVEAIFTFAR